MDSVGHHSLPGGGGASEWTGSARERGEDPIKERTVRTRARAGHAKQRLGSHI